MSLNSPFAQAFQAIMDRTQEKVPVITHIDQDMGQLQGFSTRPAIAFPCILVDFQNFVYTNMTNGAQIAEGDVVITLGFAQYTPTSNHTNPAYREEAMKYYDIEWDLNKALHNWSPGDNFGTLTRTGVTKNNVDLGIRLRILTYRLEFEDYSAVPQENKIPKPSLNFI